MVLYSLMVPGSVSGSCHLDVQESRAETAHSSLSRVMKLLELSITELYGREEELGIPTRIKVCYSVAWKSCTLLSC